MSTISTTRLTDRDFSPDEYVIRVYVSTWGVFNDDNNHIKLGTLKECVDYCRRIGLPFTFKV